MFSTTTRMLQDFLKKESAGGIILIAVAALALIVANSPLADDYFGVLGLPVVAGIGDAVINKSLLLWINDGLMAIFFFLVGLEVKREALIGQLNTWNKASLPLFAALGGFAIPALIFVGINLDYSENLNGWAIPAATDIAFALGVLALLGPRVPVALKALLLAIAVIDDIMAVSVIAIFYTEETSVTMLLWAAGTLAIMALFGRAKVASSVPYVVLGVVLWVFVLNSGVHATLAGVAAAMCVPIAAKGGERPLERMEHALHPYVAFLIIPIFGFANAGVSLTGVGVDTLLAPLPLGIALGLLIGKQVGIVGFAWLVVKTGMTSLPPQVTWRQIHALSLLAAIGFTMSLFIGNLAFEDAAMVDAVKIGVLAGSLVSAIAGYLMLRSALPKTAAEDRSDPEEEAEPARAS